MKHVPIIKSLLIDIIKITLVPIIAVGYMWTYKDMVSYSKHRRHQSWTDAISSEEYMGTSERDEPFKGL